MSEIAFDCDAGIAPGITARVQNTGSSGNASLVGGGDEVLIGLGGGDLFDGGAGNDLAYYDISVAVA